MKRRAILNFIASTSYQLLSLLIGLLLPKYYTELYGSVYNGLNQLTSQVMNLLSVLQYGISAAAVQQMFKHIAKDDKEAIAGIYQDTGKQYRNMGYIFICAIIPIALLFPYILRDELPYKIIVAFLLMRALSSAMEYFFQAKYGVILIADNRSYLIYILNSGLLIFSTILHAIALFNKQDILVYQAVSIVSTFVRLFIVSVYIKKKYPYLNKKRLSCEKIKQKSARKDVLISEIAGLIIDSTDLVVLSIFSGLVSTSIYSVYNFVVVGLGNVLSSCREAVFAGIGKSYYTDFSDFQKKMEKFESIYFAVVFYLYSVAILLFRSFVAVYTSNMDANYLYAGLPILFILAKLLVNIRIPAIVAINTAGHFKEVRNYAVVEAIINLVLSIVLVLWLGIYGVLIGTIIGAAYRTPILIRYANRNIIKQPLRQYYQKIGLWLPIFIISYILGVLINFGFTNLWQWLIGALIVAVICGVIFIIWISIFDKNLFNEIKRLIMSKKRKM